MKKFSFVLLILSIILLLYACVNEYIPKPIEDSQEEVQPQPIMPEKPEPAHPPEDIVEEPMPYTTTATLTTVGDIMMHTPQISGGYEAETNSYNFNFYFTEVKNILLSGDWVVGNLETTLAGKDSGGYTGYPMFNSPSELADALKNAGFNILTTANNHSLDRGANGVLLTLENIRARGMKPVGTNASPAEAENILVVTKNEISMAILSYTYGLNGLVMPQGRQYLVDLIDEEKITSDIQKARELGVDLVTVALHMEGEYHRLPNAGQFRLTEHVIKSGADIILGSHPHVVQPFDWIETIDDAGIPRQGLVLYSLGNFISNQGPDQGTAKYTDVGVIFNIEITKQFPDESVEITKVEPIPTWVHKYWEDDKRKHRVLPIEATLEARNDPLLNESQYTLLEQYLQEMNEHIYLYQ